MVGDRTRSRWGAAAATGSARVRPGSSSRARSCLLALSEASQRALVRDSPAKVCKHTGVAGAEMVLCDLHRWYHEADYLQNSSLIHCTKPFQYACRLLLANLVGSLARSSADGSEEARGFACRDVLDPSRHRCFYPLFAAFTVQWIQEGRFPLSLRRPIILVQQVTIYACIDSSLRSIFLP